MTSKLFPAGTTGKGTQCKGVRSARGVPSGRSREPAWIPGRRAPPSRSEEQARLSCPANSPFSSLITKLASSVPFRFIHFFYLFCFTCLTNYSTSLF